MLTHTTRKVEENGKVLYNFGVNDPYDAESYI